MSEVPDAVCPASTDRFPVRRLSRLFVPGGGLAVTAAAVDVEEESALGL